MKFKSNIQFHSFNYLKLIISYAQNDSNWYNPDHWYEREIVCDEDFEMKYVRFKCIVILLSAFILCKYNLIFVVVL